MKNRWIMNRMGLVNFWYYDKEEFHFSSGRLLLRGANGSGKSVTMQSFIPLLLDGNKSPERLDPFGSRARKIENYLLGEEEEEREERTGYLYMEFKREETDNYLTIGMGLRARRGKPLDAWGFAITDGRRIGLDFQLHKEMGEDIPLTKKELKNRIGEGGEVTESQGDYMAMVNKLLFGFENIEEYDELIKLLVQLRTPKLSKDFKPTVIYEIMNNALQPLSDEDLRPMSEAIENMDRIKSQLETLKVSKKAAEKMKTAYDQYNRYILFEKSRDVVRAHDHLAQMEKEKNNLELEKLRFETQHDEAKKRIEKLEIEEKTYKEKEQELKKHDSFVIKEKIVQLEKNIHEDRRERHTKNQLLEHKRTDERRLAEKIKETEGEEEQKIQRMEKLLEEMDEASDSCYFSEQFYLKEEVLKNIKEPYDFQYVDTQLKKYREKIIRIYELLQEEERSAKTYDGILAQLEREKREQEGVKGQLERAHQLLLETKEEFVEKMYQWEKGNQQLKIPREVLVETTQKVYHYGEKASYDDILYPIRKQNSLYEGMYREEKSKHLAKKEQVIQVMEEKKKELTEWKNKKDPEPEREGKVVRNRSRLREMGIPFVPLYMAIDFEENVSEEGKGIIEEALADMGMLDALIIPRKYQWKVFELDQDMADRYLFPSPQYLQHELSSLLRPEKLKDVGISQEEIDNVLKSILLDNQGGNAFISEKGQYGLGIIRGKVTQGYRPKFIGIQARKQFREKRIVELEREIQGLVQKIEDMDRAIGLCDEDIQSLEAEFSLFPGKDDLEIALNQVKEDQLKYEQGEREIRKRELEMKKAHEAWQLLRQQVWQESQGLKIPVHREAFCTAIEGLGDYGEQLQELKGKHLTLMELSKRLEILKEQQEKALEDIDNLLYDINRFERKIREDVERLEQLQEQLKITNYEEIQREIEGCLKRLEEIPREKEEAISHREVGKTQSENKQRQLEEIDEKIKLQQRLCSIYKEGFKQELGLGYVYEDDERREVNLRAKEVYEELKGFERLEKGKEEYFSNLQEKHHVHRQHLVEYNLITEYIFDHSVEEGAEERIKEAKGKQKRLEIKGKIQGREVGFYHLLQFIDEAIEENEKLLKESDRQLFEDILANTISKKIRAKIYNSQEWVNKMNKLMEGMNTSSGLSFSLSWRPRKGEVEDQLDTKELVELLRMDAHLLKPGDLDKLSNHFQSKIVQARKKSEELSGYQSFHNIMKEILDYRKWFEFQLFYKKTGENRKELTNTAFDRFSGGEKAMAMYVPLFSSVYARYEGANRDCPRIISLDEAFAGVDENNIRDMFRLLEELKLNFIMNSQILWGDYDTVKSLSICELIRPNNADFVTVIRYQWNGKVRELVTEEVEENEGYGIA